MTTPAQGEDDKGMVRFVPALWAVLALAVGLRLWLLVAVRATEEDFFITLRYAENLATGHGFAYNPGAPTLGTTTPLYTLLLALFVRLHLDPILSGKLFGIAADALACMGVFRLGRAVGRPGAGLAAAVCLAFAPTNLIWATKGMEVGLVAAATVWLWAFQAERRELPAWATAALLLLLRIDGAVMVVLLLAAMLWREHRVPWRGLLLFTGLTLPWMLYATVTFGSPLPLSLRAKLVVYARLTPGRFPHLREFFSLMTHNPLGLALAIGLGLFLVFMVREWRGQGAQERRAALWQREGLLFAPLLGIAIHYSAMALSKVFLFGWYFVPPTPIYYLAALTGWALLIERLRPGLAARAEARQVLAWAALASVALMAAVVPRVAATLRAGQRTEETLRIPIGLWLRANAAPTDRVMLEPIGYIGYYSRLPVIDVIALVSPEALDCYRPAFSSPGHELWHRFRPEWLLLRAGEWQNLQRDEASLPAPERLNASYTLTKSWLDSSAEQPSFSLFRRKTPPRPSPQAPNLIPLTAAPKGAACWVCQGP